MVATAAVACSADPDTSAPTTAGPVTTGGTGVVATSLPGATTLPVATPAPAVVDTPPPPAEQLAGVVLALQPFADINRPTAFVTRPADNTIYVTAQTGEVYRIPEGGAPEIALDLTAEVTPYAQGSERGLLGLAFSPVDGRMFVYYTDVDSQSRVASYVLGDNGLADPASRWAVMDIPQPSVGHKGGGMSFDGPILYLALGDGGGSNGRDAQDYSSLLGSILRVVPRSTGPGYDYPDDNPFLADPARRPELWAKGLRNPWGFWRDPVTGNLWTGDVGNNTMEEIDRIGPEVAGANFGWYFIEGTQVNYPGEEPPDAVPPLWAYRHDEIGPAAIGGRVYRGAAIPALTGAYVFADMAGATFAVGAGDEVTRLQLSISGVVTGFGIGPDGELFATTHGEGIFKIVPG